MNTVKINSTTFSFNQESQEYKAMVSLLERIATEKSIRNIESIDIAITPEHGFVHYKEAEGIDLGIFRNFAGNMIGDIFNSPYIGQALTDVGVKYLSDENFNAGKALSRLAGSAIGNKLLKPALDKILPFKVPTAIVQMLSAAAGESLYNILAGASNSDNTEIFDKDIMTTLNEYADSILNKYGSKAKSPSISSSTTPKSFNATGSNSPFNYTNQ